MRSLSNPHRPSPSFYLTVLGMWLASIAWFHGRLWSLMDLAITWPATAALLFFIAFTYVAWLYAFYNVAVIGYALVYRRGHRSRYEVNGALPLPPPAVALLYTTCNDFDEKSVESCLAQDYANFRVYILDDSSDAELKLRIDLFALRYAERVIVVRRPDRRGFKAGNINHGLVQAATDEPLFALVDADEILPRDFLSRLVPRLLADERIGFVQANHVGNPKDKSPLARALGVGIDIHWRWYHPLRNRFGFVMLLGHGALLRRDCWEQVGGFPHLVSEDLAYALRLREHGWRGLFAEDVVCHENFPPDMRAFRVRHMKWTRGTCEFLYRMAFGLLRSRRISWVEKMDILFPTLGLPLSLFFFAFVLDVNVVLPALFGHVQPLTIALGTAEFAVPVIALDARFGAVSGHDFYAITVLALVAPILCFMISMARTPRRLLSFISRSVAVYGALGPLSCLGVLCFSITRQAVFHVTAERARIGLPAGTLASGFAPLQGLGAATKQFLVRSHPDHPLVQSFEIAVGLFFIGVAVKMAQVSFLGLALAYLLHPVLHHVAWDQPWLRKLIHLPAMLMFAGLGLGGLALLGIQPVFLNFGVHF